MEQELAKALLAAKIPMTEEERLAFVREAFTALASYEDTLISEEDYDEDDAFEAVFLALTENADEEAEARVAQLLPVFMDAIDEVDSED